MNIMYYIDIKDSYLWTIAKENSSHTLNSLNNYESMVAINESYIMDILILSKITHKQFWSF